MITVFHGIGAYRGQRNPVALSRQVSTVMTGVEICGADRPIGAFGVIVAGDCTAAFDHDVWSEVDRAGNRFASGWVNEQIQPRTQFEFEEFAHKALEERKDYPRTYSEAWVRSYALRAVWVKDWAPEATKKAAKIIAKHRGVELITVCGQTRIWDVLDQSNLPLWRES